MEVGNYQKPSFSVALEQNEQGNGLRHVLTIDYGSYRQERYLLTGVSFSDFNFVVRNVSSWKKGITGYNSMEVLERLRPRLEKFIRIDLSVGEPGSEFYYGEHLDASFLPSEEEKPDKERLNYGGLGI